MNQSLSDHTAPLAPLSPQLLDVCQRFEAAWEQTGNGSHGPRVEDYLGDVVEPERTALLQELLCREAARRRLRGEQPEAEEYRRRFPGLSPDWLAWALGPRSPGSAPTADEPAQLRCPHCHNPIRLADTHEGEVLCPACGGSFAVRDATHTNTVSTSKPLGKFHLLERIGQGAFGAVWKARDGGLDRVVALKIPHTGLLTEEEELERFHREARAAAQLRHPGIVTVHEVQTLEGLPVIVSDFVQGVTLKDFLEVRRLTFREAAELIASLAEALEYAHTMGVVHRDIKPANIMIERGAAKAALGKPMLMDFGLALRDEAEVTLTMDGHVIGTPAYMSPEQAAGKSHQADRRSDVYSLGVVLYELLAGELPFRGSKAMILYQVLSEEPRSPRKLNDRVPRDLETVCLKCLHKEPGRRYQSAGDLAADLRRYLAGEPVKARPVGMLERVVRWARRRPAAAALVVFALLVVLGIAVGGILYDQQLRRTRAEGLVAALRSAETPAVSRIVQEVAEVRHRVEPALRAVLNDPGATEREKLHASLALLPGDAGQVEYLYGRLLPAEPQEVVVIRDALRPHAEILRERLWPVLEDAKSDSGQRLRAACALAAYAEDDARWPKVSRDVTDRLLAENVLVIGQWAKALKPVGRHLMPHLAGLIQEEGRGASDRRVMAGLYKDFAEGVADGFVPLETVLAEQPPAAGDNMEPRLAVLRRQANAAVALAAAGRWEKVAPLLRHSPDPTLRSYLIDRLGPGGGEARAMIERLNPEREPDVSARRALLLTLGEFGPDRLLRAEREALVPQLLALYRDDPDPGIHGAAGWLLRHWQQQSKVEEIDQASREHERSEGRRWYVNRQGQTMVVVPPGEYEGGLGEGKRQKVKVERSFALAAREVTVAEFLRFRKGHKYEKQYAPTEDCPVNAVSWYDAAAYCNWLSKEEGIPEEQWCYEPNEKKEYADGMKGKANVLTLSGYRLPTEAEWELACRAGSATDWSMGNAEELLAKYAWYDANSLSRLHPVGVLRPNALGLFDLHGNDWEWCNNRYQDYSDINIYTKDHTIDNKSGRSLRGGAFNYNASNVRSSYRHVSEPGFRHLSFGFRPARTFR